MGHSAVAYRGLYPGFIFDHLLVPRAGRRFDSGQFTLLAIFAASEILGSTPRKWRKAEGTPDRNGFPSCNVGAPTRGHPSWTNKSWSPPVSLPCSRCVSSLRRS